MSRIGTRRALLYRPAAASGNWWEVSGQTCVAAYQPKGATDLAASYVNLANPGTYNATPGTAPSFATATGWTFTAASSQYLTTGIVPDNNQAWSMIARFTSGALGTFTCIIGSNFAVSKGFAIAGKSDGGAATYWYSGGLSNVLGTICTGVVCVAGTQGYKDGSAIGSAIPAAAGTHLALDIGRLNYSSPGYYANATIAAIAVYSTTLSASDVAALSTVMAAL